MKPNYQLFNAIILDFDGVILDSEPIHCEAWDYVLKNIGLNLSYEEYREKYLGLSNETLFPRLLASKGINVPVYKINLMINEKISRFTSIINHKNSLPVVKGVAQYIKQAINEKKPLAICSGATQQEILATLKKLEPDIRASDFEFIITADQVHYGKPSPEGYLLTAQHLGFAANQCLVIEDSPHGIMAAKKAGMYVIALLTSHEEVQLQDADYITRDFESLMVNNCLPIRLSLGYDH